MHNITIPNTKQIKPIKPVSMDIEKVNEKDMHKVINIEIYRNPV